MISADILARELGCTLSDLDDLNVMPPLQPEHMVYGLAADRIGHEAGGRDGEEAGPRTVHSRDKDETAHSHDHSIVRFIG